MQNTAHRVTVLTILVAMLLVPFLGVDAQPLMVDPSDDQVVLADYELIGTVNFPTGYTFNGTVVGGLSSITYDESRGVFYALSDDQGTINPVRYYTLDIDLADGQLDPGDITFLEVTFLRDESGELFAPTSLDPEGIVLARPGFLFVSSEGFALRAPPINPFINRFNLPGMQTKAAPVPGKFLPNATGTQGVRQNLGFESLNVTPDRQYLYSYGLDGYVHKFLAEFQGHNAKTTTEKGSFKINAHLWDFNNAAIKVTAPTTSKPFPGQ